MDSDPQTSDSQAVRPAHETAPGGHGVPVVVLQVQTPRGLWSETLPKDAEKRPVYPISTKVETVIADARLVFGFSEQDSQYTLFLGSAQLEPQRTLASFHITNGVLFVLSVQGGNAAGRCGAGDASAESRQAVGHSVGRNR